MTIAHLAYGLAWIGIAIAGTVSVLLAQEVVTPQPAVLIGAGAVAASIVGLIVPITKLWLEQRDKDRSAMLESAKVAAQLGEAFHSIQVVQSSLERLQGDLLMYRESYKESLSVIIANQGKFAAIEPAIRAFLEQQHKA